MRTPTLSIIATLLLLLPMVGHADEPAERSKLLTSEKPEVRFLYNMVERVNSERVQKGLLPLKLSENLMKAAECQAQAMATNHYLDSRTPDGRNANAYAFEQGFPGMTGQSLYRGKADANEMVSLWLTDSTNRDNLLSPDCNQIGVGRATADDRYGNYVVLEMGRLMDGYPVVIDHEAYAVDSQKVTLSLYGEGTIEKMRFSNDGTNFSDWEPFQPTREWTLATGEGKRTVYVELSDGNRVYSSQDSVILRPATCTIER